MGYKIKLLRDEKGMTQEELSKKAASVARQLLLSKIMASIMLRHQLF